MGGSHASPRGFLLVLSLAVGECTLESVGLLFAGVHFSEACTLSASLRDAVSFCQSEELLFACFLSLPAFSAPDLVGVMGVFARPLWLKASLFADCRNSVEAVACGLTGLDGVAHDDAEGAAGCSDCMGVSCCCAAGT